MGFWVFIKITFLFISVFMSFNLFANEEAIDKHKIELAVTFDDLPAIIHPGMPKSTDKHPAETSTEIIENILSVLKRHKLTHIYGFMNGITTKYMEERYKILKMWKEAGHLLGNHTYDHLDYLDVTSEKFIKDIEDNESIMLDYVDSIEELKYFRFPFLQEGNTKDKRYAVRSYLFRRNYKIAEVTVDFEDWVFGPSYMRCVLQRNLIGMRKLEKIYMEYAEKRLIFADELARFIYGKPKKQILLLHVNLITSRMLDKLLKKYEELGVKYIPFAEAEADPIYKEDPGIWANVGKSFLLQALESRKLNNPKAQIIIPRELIESICR